MIFSKNTIKDAARLAMARWYNKVEDAACHSFNVIAATFNEHYDESLNFYNNRASNALAECFNAKIKLFRANLRGVADKKFFLFRLAKLLAFPHRFATEPWRHVIVGLTSYLWLRSRERVPSLFIIHNLPCLQMTDMLFSKASIMSC